MGWMNLWSKEMNQQEQIRELEAQLYDAKNTIEELKRQRDRARESNMRLGAITLTREEFWEAMSAMGYKVDDENIFETIERGLFGPSHADQAPLRADGGKHGEG